MNDEEILLVKKQLSKLEPGYLPEPIFQEFARLSVSGILELVPLRRNSSNQIEVLVVRRDENDPHWPGQLHTPGTMLRPTDSDDFSTAFKRVFAEIERTPEDYQVKKIDTVFHTVNRGKELAIIFAVMIEDVKDNDYWVVFDEIDSLIVSTQVNFVKNAVIGLLKYVHPPRNY